MSSFLEVLLQHMQDLPAPGQELIARQQNEQAMMQQQAAQQSQTRHVNLPPAQGTTMQAQPLGGSPRVVNLEGAQTRRVEAQPLGGEEQMAEQAPPRKQAPPRLSARAVAELLKHITSA